MALSQGNQASWSDISALFTSLNAARKKFNFSEFTPTSSNPQGATQGGTIYPAVVSKLNDLIVEMRSNRYVSTNANSRITVPSRGTLLRATELGTLRSQIDTINNLCADDSNRSFDGFSQCGNFGNFGNRSDNSVNGNNSFNAIFGFCWNVSN